MMGVSSHMQLPGVLPAVAYRRPHDRVLSWPLAVAAICGLSVGMWVLLYQMARLLLRF